MTFTLRLFILLHEKINPWPESGSELCRPSGHRLSEKLMPTFADRRCHKINVTDPYGRILDFLDQVACMSKSKSYRNRMYHFKLV
jgi:hypothetical protein